ncbi:15726_t:CDS:1, partial [Gigaspora rosea]
RKISVQQTDELTAISNTQRGKRKTQYYNLKDQKGVDCDYEKN